MRLSPATASLITFLLASAVATPLLAQHNARDAFWSASDLVAVSANPGARPGSVRAAAAPRRRPAPAPDARAHMDPILVAQNGYGEQPHLIKVSDEQIGVRYSILLRDSANKYNEVSPNQVFHSGDYVHLSVMSNRTGYLYVIQQGSSGNWSAIFPRKGSPVETNKVEAGKLTEIPSGKQAFQFDSTPGQEKLFIVVSRKPIEDLDATIGGLKKTGGQNTQGSVAAPGMQTYEASNRIPDELMKRFASRDLSLVETTEVEDSKKPDGSGEKAVYVVSKGSVSSSGSQVVAPLTFNHN